MSDNEQEQEVPVATIHFEAPIHSTSFSIHVNNADALQMWAAAKMLERLAARTMQQEEDRQQAQQPGIVIPRSDMSSRIIKGVRQ